MEILTNWNIDLKIDHILRAQGIDPRITRNRGQRIHKIAELAINMGLPLLEPKVVQETYQVYRLIQGKLELQKNGIGKHHYLSGTLISQSLATAEEVIVMVCTIGDTLEKVSAKMMKTEPLHGWALDSLGSAAIELLATQACNQIKAHAETRGKKSTLPLNPGMVGWPIDRGQTEIFALVDPSHIDVFLNENYQMTPCKTVSLIIGIGHKVTENGRICNLCNMNTSCRFQKNQKQTS